MEQKVIDFGSHKAIVKYETKSIVVLPQKPSALFSVVMPIIDMAELLREIPDLEGLTVKDIPVENIKNFDIISNVSTLKALKLEMLNLKSIDFLDKLENVTRLSIHSNPLKANVSSIDFERYETVVLDFEQGMYLDLDKVPDFTAVFFTGPFDISPTRLDEMIELKESALQIIEFITQNPMTDLEKVLFVHNHLLKNVEYRAARFKLNGKEYVDNEILKNGERWTSVFNPYGALVKNTALCNGIESTMRLILNHPKVNVRCEQVGGYSEGYQHIWNMVYVDGIPYHLDTTFDILKNPSLAPGKFKAQKLSTEIFLLGDDDIKKDRELSNKKYPVCPKTYPREKIDDAVVRLLELGVTFTYKGKVSKEKGSSHDKLL